MMNKNKAINILKGQKEKILTNIDIQLWLDTTNQMLEKIFPLSYQKKCKSLEKINFVCVYERNPLGAEERERKGRQKASEYIDEFINEIGEMGLEKKEENNLFIRLLKSVLFWTILVAIISGSFYFGHYFGYNRFDKEKIEMTKEIDELKSTNKKLEKILSDIKKQKKSHEK